MYVWISDLLFHLMDLNWVCSPTQPGREFTADSYCNEAMELFILPSPLSDACCAPAMHQTLRNQQWKKKYFLVHLSTHEDIQSAEPGTFVFGWVSGLGVHSFL